MFWFLRGRGSRIYLSLIAAMLAGRLVWGLVQFLLAGLQGTEFSLALFLSGAVTTAILASHVIEAARRS